MMTKWAAGRILWIVLLALMSGCSRQYESPEFDNFAGTRMIIERAQNGGYLDVDWSANDKITLGASTQRPDESMYLGDPTTGKVNLIARNADPVFGIAPTLSPSEQFLAFTDYVSGGIKILQLTQPPQEYLSIPDYGPVTWSRDGKRLAVVSISTSYSLSLSVVDMQNRSLTEAFERSTERLGPVDGISWSPDERYVVFSMASKVDTGDLRQYDLYLIDLEHKEMRQLTSSSSENEKSPSWTSDGKSIVFASLPITNSTEGKLGFIDLVDDCIKKASRPIGIARVSVSPNGEQMAVVSAQGNAYVIDVASVRQGIISDNANCPIAK